MPKPRPVPLTTLNVRGIPRSAVEQIKRAARARGLTIGEYLTRLANLPDRVRAMALEATGGHGPAIEAALRQIGLETVTT